MIKIKTLAELDKIRESARPALEPRMAGGQSDTGTARGRQVLVCGGTGCHSSGCGEARSALLAAMRANHIGDVDVVTTGCYGFCEQGPIIKVFPGNVFYTKVRAEDAREIAEKHLLNGEVVERLLYHDNDGGVYTAQEDIPFYGKQLRIALRNCGIIDPERIEDYIGMDGYRALAGALAAAPGDAADKLKRAGLRGRGGAGFPTGVKWEAAMREPGDKKYIVCNADEGDPGAFMDRSILEGDPHAVLEAMAIAGYAAGADQGVIYIRAEYPLAVERLGIAIKQAEDYGLLGENILSSGFNFNIHLNLGAGAFVCGEETSLINSVQGARGEPRGKPPFPAQSGLWGKPTVINNVETFANVCPILLNGPEWFARIGAEKSKGTKVFALAGQINNVGLVEVPMGTTLREIVFDIGGGIRGGKAFKSVQTGGPSGGCIPERFLDLPIDYESLAGIGSMMGSGGMIVMDETDCMVDISKFYLEFTADESCGKCTPCRIGCRRLLELLQGISEGRGTYDDLEELESLSRIIADTSLCGLGQTAPNPILSTLKYFREEYEAHVRDKRCPAGACAGLRKYRVIPGKCVGCTVCAKKCPVNTITGEAKQAHFINQDNCTKCGACLANCKFGAIEYS